MKSSLLFICFVICLHSFAQKAGTLDSSFGVEGVRNIKDIKYEPTFALQADQKVIVCGGSENGLLLQRFLPDGNIDLTFGNKGSLYPHFDSVLYINHGSVVIQPDQKILVITNGLILGYYLTSIAVARYWPTGIIDSTFGVNGKIVLSHADQKNEAAVTAIVQSDESIVIGGSSSNNSESREQAFLLRRITNAGKVDSSFGNNGSVATRLNPNYNSILRSLIYQPDGKIVAGGFSGLFYNTSDNIFALARYLPNGNLDSSFGDKGLVQTDYGKNGEQIFSLGLQNDGKLIAVGAANIYYYSQSMAIVRYTNNGLLDKTFATAGKLTVKIPEASLEGKSVNITSTGKIIVTGDFFYNADPLFESKVLIKRFDTSGSTDSLFGTNGTTISEFTTYDVSYNSAILKNQNLLLLGQSYPGPDANNNYTFLARYYGDPVKQQSPIVKKIKRWLKNHTLNWQYNDDANVAYYSIQQSSNGINGFKEIAKVNGHQLVVNSEYSFNLNNSTVNRQLSSVGYYKIIAVSKSGNVVSDIISDKASITISPNPVKDILTISGLPPNQKSTISIISRNGNILQSAICNNSVCNMNISQLKSGIYNVQVVSNGTSQTIKFIKE